MSDYFNSRPCMRGDSFGLELEKFLVIFQFTPLHEGRLGSTAVLAAIAAFQFTPLREGRRRDVDFAVNKIHIFQFTPLREGRPSRV